MFLFSLAASTRSWLLGATILIAAALGAATYASQDDRATLTPVRFAIVFLPLAAFILAQVFERYKIHWEKQESFW